MAGAPHQETAQDGQPDQPEQPIYDAASLCAKSFAHHLDTDNGTASNYLEIEELSARFNQWAAYVGAFAMPRASLDARLAPYEDIRDMVLELLYMIQDNLTWIASDDDTEDMTETSPGLPAVGAAIDRLLILSVNIRRSARQTHRFRQGSSTTQHNSICSLLRLTRYPKARESLCSQLGTSIHIRGISLQYMQEHNKKLSFRRNDGDKLGAMENNQAGLEEQVPSAIPTDKVLSLNNQKTFQGPETLPSAISPSKIALIDRNKRVPSSSVVSTGSVVQDGQNNDYEYPPQPKQQVGKRYQSCVICAMPLEPVALTKRAWHAHVDQDIEPYVCISEDCIEPPQYFAKLEDWMNHMRTRHSMNWSEQIHTERWHCDLHDSSDIELPEFDTKAEFLNHLNTCHGKKLTESQILGRIRRNRRIATRAPFVCPFCDCIPAEVAKNIGEKPYMLLWKHIAQHLRSVAFLSLSYVEVFLGSKESIADSTEASDRSIGNTSQNTHSDIDHDEYCSRVSCDCHDKKNSALEWDSIDTIFGSSAGIPQHQLPPNHHDPSYAPGTSSQAEWEFLYPSSLPPELRQIGPPKYQGHAKDTKLMRYFQRYRERIPNDRYTIGWICSIYKEHTAARAFLDEEHGRPEYTSTNDDNIYTLGRIGNHNVVIASQPRADFGMTSGAHVAVNISLSFPNLVLHLIVGIGGGAPSQSRDIRLGDIVVGALGNGVSAVTQYDSAISTPSYPGLKSLDLLKKLPMPFVKAINQLQTQYEMDSHQLEKIINQALQTSPRVPRKYTRPEPATDKLFKSEYKHESVCAMVCNDDPSSLMARPERAKEGPELHFGRIVSTNTLIKDASLRDRLAVDHEVLCFETNAAGLMNAFPCLVICGICSYSDDHRSNEWRGYAALAAAAYAKDLLHHISTNMIEAEAYQVPVSGTVDPGNESHQTSSAPGSDTIEPSHSVISAGLEMVEYNGEFEYFLDENSSRQSYVFRKWQQDTGQWLLDSAEFHKWFDTKGGTLLCPGIPGAGKTVMTSLVVSQLSRFQSRDVGIAYFYCRHSANYKHEYILMTLLRQLARCQDYLPRSVKDLHDRFNFAKVQPSRDEISKIFQSFAAQFSRIYIIVDGLDECETVIEFMEDLFALRAKVEINLFVTSRFIPEIISKFQGSLVLEIRARHGDVRRYLHGCMAQAPDFIKQDLQLQRDIVLEISAAVDGMFLLARPSLDLILAGGSRENALRILHQLQKEAPTGPDKLHLFFLTYAYTMDRIEHQPLELCTLAKQALLCVKSAKRPLTISELEDMLAHKPGSRDIISICAGLIQKDEKSDKIQVAHYTVLQYLEQVRLQGVISMIEVCVKYLTSSVFGGGFCDTDDSFEARLSANPFFDYAARNWGHHARESSTVHRKTLLFLKLQDNVEAASQVLNAVKRFPKDLGYSQAVPKHVKGIHLAAYFGATDLVNCLLEGGLDPDPRDSYGRTPLWYACQSGHKSVVLLLLDKRADVAARDRDGCSPLLTAVSSQELGIVKVLLENGAHIETRDQKGQTPLSLAAAKGYIDTVQLLLDSGANINARDLNNRTPRELAAMENHRPIVELLSKFTSIA